MPIPQCPVQEWNEKMAAPSRCPMCGALRVGDNQGDHHPTALANEVMREIAFWHEKDPFAVEILLKRIREPDANYAQLAEGTGKTRDALGKKIRKMAAEHPELSTFLGLNSRYSRGQRKRREAESIQMDKLGRTFCANRKKSFSGPSQSTVVHESLGKRCHGAKFFEAQKNAEKSIDAGVSSTFRPGDFAHKAQNGTAPIRGPRHSPPDPGDPDGIPHI